MHKEEDLIKGCLKGDRKYQRELYEHFSKKMLVVCLRYTKSTLEAEDVLQEAFIKVFQNLKNFRGDSKLETWIKRIVVNTALNHQRSKLYLYPMVDVDNMHYLSDKKPLPISNYHFEELLKMIQALPVGCQVIFNLYAIEGYQHNEIAESLNINIGTSKSQYARARQLLQNMISNSERENYEKYK
ncbi:MAG: RNA polymerase sigma factor [Candidatus Cyclobacteriaceae bacterium M3_2C_046]